MGPCNRCRSQDPGPEVLFSSCWLLSLLLPPAPCAELLLLLLLLVPSLLLLLSLLLLGPSSCCCCGCTPVRAQHISWVSRMAPPTQPVLGNTQANMTNACNPYCRIGCKGLATLQAVALTCVCGCRGQAVVLRAKPHRILVPAERGPSTPCY